MKNLFVVFLIVSSTISVSGQIDLIPKVVVTTLGTYVGYSNNSGEMVIPAQFKEAHPFYNGLARVKNDEELYGFINKKGEVVIPFKFREANDFYRNTGYGEKKPVDLNFITVTTTEEYQKKSNLGEVYYREQSSTSTRKIGRSGIINTKGEYVVPLVFQGESRIEGDFALIRFTKDKESFSALINEEGKVAFGPVPGNIHVAENNIIVTYLNADEINGQPNYLSVLYDLEGNRILGVEKRYGLISESGNPQFLDVNRNILQGDEVISKNGLIDLQGNEIIQTLYKRIRWESDIKLFRVLIESNKYDDTGESDVFFYANEKGECVAKESVPCPAPPPAGFNYESYISKGHKIVKDINETTQIPWLIKASSTMVTVKNSTGDNKSSAENNTNKGEGPIFTDMNGIWVQSPPPAQGGYIFKINKIQKNALCGDYKYVSETLKFEAKLKCIHANETGYVFYIEFYNRPSFAKGERYLHVFKKVKKGRTTYKIAVFNGFVDTSFEQQKLMYNKYVQTAELRNKGYNSSWWFWSFY